ncbi:glycoside hydrolase family 43 protein [Flagellimonas sp. DF-77]|uniref:glycoside hydrolase family 43 protein n=1 Tax=Flagellimonas algarum TaxID=3230298 RepID=UPI00339858B9
MQLENPILRGFNPDPSIIRVNDDYYIATSTFEWFPGVQIYHSKDLKHWQLIARPLSRPSQLDMHGVPDSCGVWAPCLSYDNGVFYLVYSNVKSFDGVWKDTPNFLVTTTDIHGEWSEPIYLSSRGFDGSLFHASDGKKWFLNMLIDHRAGKFFGGIEMQEYDPDGKKLVGPVHYLTEGSALGISEGPHLLEKDGWCYLILAEGGTEYGHALSVARSKSITGPYVFHPENPIISAAQHPANYLQKTGHGDFVNTPDGEWYAVFLCGRPLTPLGKCPLGRETAMEELVWQDGWPKLKHGRVARKTIEGPQLAEVPIPQNPARRNFESTSLPLEFQSLRVPITDDWCSLQERPGYLRLFGKESLSSTHRQSLLARRVQAFHIEAATAISFEPQHLQHMAGLVFYYNTGHYHYAYITADYEGKQSYLSVATADNFEMGFQDELIPIPKEATVVLKGVMDHDRLQFSYSIDGTTFHPLGQPLDASILSDDHVREGGQKYRAAFTGCFVGICCQDLAMNSHHADFKWFEYIEK